MSDTNVKPIITPTRENAHTSASRPNTPLAIHALSTPDLIAKCKGAITAMLGDCDFSEPDMSDLDVEIETGDQARKLLLQWLGYGDPCTITMGGLPAAIVPGLDDEAQKSLTDAIAAAPLLMAELVRRLEAKP